MAHRGSGAGGSRIRNRVDPEQMGLAHQVAAVISEREIRRAVATVHRTKVAKGTIKTTFCPVCGGNKDKLAVRCSACARAARAKGRANSRAHGNRRGTGRGAFGYTRESIGRQASMVAHPDLPPPMLERPELPRGGHVRCQPWERKVLFEGVWMTELDRARAIQAMVDRAAEDEAVRALKARGFDE